MKLALKLTRRYRFCASHRLDTPALNAQENQRLYGKCNNPYGHGHDYVLEVTVEGAVDSNGQIVNRRELDELVNERVLRRFDHKDLSKDVAGLAGVVATTENLARAIRDALVLSWPPGDWPPGDWPSGDWASGDWPPGDRPAGDWPLRARLARVRISETDRNIFELNV